jgi:toxoflavin biosynthesis protein ToxD
VTTQVAPEIEWRVVPAGPFLMGSDPAGAYPPDPDEQPRHSVSHAAFQLSRTAVTSSQYRVFTAATGRRPGVTGEDDCPITYVSWHDAQAFCEWSGTRLPTEAEWEAAARGGDERLWPWGDEPPDSTRCVFAAGIGGPSPAGRLPRGASPAGALDMAGNVWEWVSSAYRPYPYDASDGREQPGDAEPRVVRGGSYLDGPGGVRCSVRRPMLAPARDTYVGFRVVRVEVASPLGFEWVDVRAGDAVVGRDPAPYLGEALADETPQHLVELPSFELSVTPVTNAQYESFVATGAVPAPAHWLDGTPPPGLRHHPVTWVDWLDAAAFCSWAGGRLPSEAEWEKAARGTDARRYPWGSEDDHDGRAVVGAGIKHGSPAPVGALPAGASPYGLLEMSGNVWEWVSSAYRPYPYDADDGREDVGEGPERVLRGGSFASPGLAWARCASRSRSHAVRRQCHIGFRVARECAS